MLRKFFLEISHHSWIPGWTVIVWEMILVLPKPLIEITSVYWRRVRMTSLQRRESLCNNGDESRWNWATNHLILAAWGRVSNSSFVVASGGGDVSASTVVGAAVTSFTDPTMVSGSRWRSSSSKLSARTARLPSGCTSCKTGCPQGGNESWAATALGPRQGEGVKLHRQHTARPSHDFDGSRPRTSFC